MYLSHKGDHYSPWIRNVSYATLQVSWVSFFPGESTLKWNKELFYKPKGATVWDSQEKTIQTLCDYWELPAMFIPSTMLMCLQFLKIIIKEAKGIKYKRKIRNRQITWKVLKITVQVLVKLKPIKQITKRNRKKKFITLLKYKWVKNNNQKKEKKIKGRKLKDHKWKQNQSIKKWGSENKTGEKE